MPLLEVHTTSRPARPGRALTTAGLLLLLACGLAAQMAYDRSRSPLAGVVAPPNWAIAFRPPKRFHLVTWSRISSSVAIPFVEKRPTGPDAILVFWRETAMEPPDSASFCAQILQNLDASRGIAAPPAMAETKPFADRRGTELRSADGHTVVRAAVLKNRQMYAVSLTVQGEAIEDRLYDLFDHTCRAIRLRNPSGAASLPTR